MQKEFEDKLAFLRNKLKDMEEEGLVKSRKIQVLEEQVIFEGRMREMNMQKRYLAWIVYVWICRNVGVMLLMIDV